MKPALVIPINISIFVVKQYAICAKQKLALKWKHCVFHAMVRNKNSISNDI